MYEYAGFLENVIDGDTIDVIIDVGFKMTTNQRIRLAKIDTPEIFHVSKDSEEYKMGMKAKEYVEKRMNENNGKFVIKTGKLVGVYGRYIGEIFFADSNISLNDELLEKNLASKYK